MAFGLFFKKGSGDLPWTLSLFGAAVGAGILYLPVRAGLSGVGVTLALALLIYPIIYCSHRLFASVVFHTKMPCDYTCAVGELINPRIGAVVSGLFTGLLLMLLMTYTTALNNSLGQFALNHGLAANNPARSPWLSLVLLSAFFGLLRCGTSWVIRVLGVLSGVLILMLGLLSFSMMDLWQFENAFGMSQKETAMADTLLLFPILVESFIFFPALSSMVIAFRNESGTSPDTWKRTLKVVRNATLLLVGFTLFFVFSCLFALPPDLLADAADKNLSALDILVQTQSPLLAEMGPLISILALTTSFFGVFMGYRESVNSLLKLKDNNWGEGSFLVMTLLVLWGFSILDLSVLSILGEVGGPLAALFLFLIPAWAHIKTPGHFGERKWLVAFVLSAGLIQVCSYYLGSL